MVQLELSRIIIDEQRREQVIVLKEKEGNRTLPVVIGIHEASSIRMELSGFVPPRPLTHDLICSLLRSLDIRLERVVIDQLVDSTFHAKLWLNVNNGQQKIIDARPSDSIALAVRLKSPIFVEEAVFDRLSQGI